MSTNFDPSNMIVVCRCYDYDYNMDIMKVLRNTNDNLLYLYHTKLGFLLKDGYYHCKGEPYPFYSMSDIPFDFKKDLRPCARCMIK